MSRKPKSLQINPLAITESLGYTTFRRDSRKPWTKEEDAKLTQIVHEKLISHGFEGGINQLFSQTPTFELDWEAVSDELGTRKPKECKKRWNNSLNPTLKKGKWTPEEDEMLINLFKEFGSSWQKISLAIPGRTDDQCAKRYIEVLDPSTKDRLRPWTIDEDLLLIKKVKTYGTKWRTISNEMVGRPSLTCRNRWRKIVTEVVRGKANAVIKQEIDSIKNGASTVEKINDELNKQKAKRGQNAGDEHAIEMEDEDHEEDDNENGNESVNDANNDNNGNNDSNESNDNNNSSSNGAVNKAKQHTYQNRYEKSYRIDNSSINHSKTRDKSKGEDLGIPLTSMGSPSFQGLFGDSPKPTMTDLEWKYTIKDPSGLSISNGNISNSELAKELISNARKYDLKISIHQHIHHHYGSSGYNKMGSPGDTSSQVSNNNNNSSNNTGNKDKDKDNSTSLVGAGSVNNDDVAIPNRFNHFNYLPPMTTPQLESSSSRLSKENDLLRLLNPLSSKPHDSEMGSSSHYQKKRRTSSSASSQSRNSKRKKSFNYEELEEELDFWETMRSLSEVVQSGSNINVPSSSSNSREKSYMSGSNVHQNQHHHGHQHSQHNQNSQHHTSQHHTTNTRISNPTTNYPADSTQEFGLFYGDFKGDEEELLDLEDMDGLLPPGMLPFNPS